eukprot:scaffold31926_cov32-Tisochrysis_lutea.AAC.1
MVDTADGPQVNVEVDYGLESLQLWKLEELALDGSRGHVLLECIELLYGEGGGGVWRGGRECNREGRLARDKRYDGLGVHPARCGRIELICDQRERPLLPSARRAAAQEPQPIGEIGVVALVHADGGDHHRRA